MIFQPCTVLTENGWQRGEYTGFSEITGMHHVSLYNGDVVKRSSLTGIVFDNIITNQ